MPLPDRIPGGFASSLVFVKRDGTTALTANWDAGAFDIRARNFTADALTAGRVVFTGANGLLSEEAAFTWTTANARLDLTKMAIGETQGNYGLSLNNTTAAADGAQQYSPPIRWRGYGFAETGTASMAVDFRAFSRPIQSAGAAPTGALDFQSSINGGAYSGIMTLLSNGRVGFGTDTPLCMQDIVGQHPQILLSNTVADATGKYSGMRARQYSSDAEPEGFVIFATISNSANLNKVSFGGSMNESNAANAISFYTAADTTTRTGTERLHIDSAGNLALGTTTIDGGAEGCFTIKNGAAPDNPTVDQAYLWGLNAAEGPGYAALHMMGEKGITETVVGVVVKADAGQTANPHTGLIEVNTNENKIYMYAEAGWREMATW